jgi:hypothetical protein
MNEFAVAAREDATPELLAVEDFQPVGWSTLIKTLISHCSLAIAAAHVVEPAPELPPSLAKVLEACDGELRCLKVAIGGTNADKAYVKALRDAIFGTRTVIRSRPGYVIEFGTLIPLLTKLEDCPSAAKKMVPRLEAVELTLTGLLPTGPGRKANDIAPTPDGVQDAVLALNFALNDLLRQASWAASDQRLSNFNRILMGRRGSDAGSANHTPPGDTTKPATTEPTAAVEAKAPPRAEA